MRRKKPASDGPAGQRDESAEAASADAPSWADVPAVVGLLPDDDVATVCARLDLCDSSRVVLRARRGVGALAARAPWRTLVQHARDNGQQLYLVAGPSWMRSLARREGVRLLRRVPRGPNDFHRPLPAFGEIARAVLLLAVVGLGGAALLFAAPSATIIVPVTPRHRQVEVTFTADRAASVPNPDSETIPAERRLITVQRTFLLATTGRASAPYETAQAELSFVNQSSRPVTIPRGTAIEANSGVRFLTDADLSLPGTPGAVGRVSAEADRKGAVGNAPAGTINGLPASLGGLVAVSNPAAATGGSDLDLAYVTQKDLDQARALARSAIEDIALHQLEHGDPARFVFPGTSRTDEFKVAFDRKPAAITVYFQAVVTAQVSVLTATETDLLAVSRPAGTLLGPSTYPLPDATQVTAVEIKEYNPYLDRLRGTATVDIGYAEGVTPALVRAYAQASLHDGLGASLERHFGLPAPAVVRVSPRFAPFVPWLAARVHVRLVAR